MTRTGFLRGLVVLVYAGLFVGPTGVLAEELADGLALFTVQKCNMCHSVPQAGVVAKMKSAKLKGPDLPAEPRESDWIVNFLTRKIKLNGKSHKQGFKGTDEELLALAAWLVELKESE